MLRLTVHTSGKIDIEGDADEVSRFYREELEDVEEPRKEFSPFNPTVNSAGERANEKDHVTLLHKEGKYYVVSAGLDWLALAEVGEGRAVTEYARRADVKEVHSYV